MASGKVFHIFTTLIKKSASPLLVLWLLDDKNIVPWDAWRSPIETIFETDQKIYLEDLPRNPMSEAMRRILKV